MLGAVIMRQVNAEMTRLRQAEVAVSVPDLQAIVDEAASANSSDNIVMVFTVVVGVAGTSAFVLAAGYGGSQR